MLHANGVDLALRESGEGAGVLLLHETATGAGVWAPLSEALGERARVVSYDRRGWGDSGAPQTYARTTVEEQSEDAAALIEALALAPALLCGAGIGAVAALDLMLRRPSMCSAAILIEPPLLAFVPEATPGLSADREAIEDAVREGGPAGAMDLYLTGGLPYLGAGAGRIPAEIAADARNHPLSLFAELGAVPSWQIRPAELGSATIPSRIVVSATTPPVVRTAADGLRPRLAGTEPAELDGEGLPHLTAAPELAGLLMGLLDS